MPSRYTGLATDLANMRGLGVGVVNAPFSPLYAHVMLKGIALCRPRASAALGLQVGDCGRGSMRIRALSVAVSVATPATY
jgi:hypothetical protein